MDGEMTQLRIMTYNMLHAPGDRFTALHEVVRSAQPDILACQEIDDIPALLRLSEQLRMPAVIGYSNRPEDPPAPEHVAVLSRWPIVHLHLHAGDPEVMFRPVLEVWIAPPALSLLRCFVVHFRAMAGPVGSRVKMQEAEHLCELVAAAEPPYCALGDFNALTPGEFAVPSVEDTLQSEWGKQWPWDHREAVQGGVISRLAATGMIDTWRQVNDPAQVPHATLRDRASARVDYIWVDETLAPLVASSQVLRTPQAERASDHFPVISTFQFPTAS
jgi:endonuclease/exonuclease/phosphatase family metal-dependent hydrolase